MSCFSTLVWSQGQLRFVVIIPGRKGLSKWHHGSNFGNVLTGNCSFTVVVPKMRVSIEEYAWKNKSFFRDKSVSDA